jgi:hypothetical protein
MARPFWLSCNTGVVSGGGLSACSIATFILTISKPSRRLSRNRHANNQVYADAGSRTAEWLGLSATLVAVFIPCGLAAILFLPSSATQSILI